MKPAGGVAETVIGVDWLGRRVNAVGVMVISQPAGTGKRPRR